MNMHAKPELFAPCFPLFELAENIEVDADMVRFTLNYGCVEIDCEMQAVELSDTIYVEPQFQPESFLSCLHGSEPGNLFTKINDTFLSCLHGSEPSKD